jgi:hypothetical protein
MFVLPAWALPTAASTSRQPSAFTILHTSLKKLRLTYEMDFLLPQIKDASLGKFGSTLTPRSSGGYCLASGTAQKARHTLGHHQARRGREQNMQRVAEM